MAGSIKIFRFIQKFHGIIGIYPPQPFEQQRSINTRNTMFLISCVKTMFTTVAFLIFEAQSMFDYGFAFLLSICVCHSTVIYALFIRRSENTFKCIATYEAFIEKSKRCERNNISAIKHETTLEFISINFYETALLPTGKNSKIAYEKSVEQIELFTKWFFIVNLYTIVSCTFDALPYTIIRYYYYDMGDESFYLFCPGWFVFTIKWNASHSPSIKSIKSAAFYLSFGKVSIQLENAIRIFGGFFRSNCGSDNGRNCIQSFPQFHSCILLAPLHFCWRQYNGVGCIQYWRQSTGSKSSRIDEPLLWLDTDLFGCEAVTNLITMILSHLARGENVLWSYIGHTRLSPNAIELLLIAFNGEHSTVVLTTNVIAIMCHWIYCQMR